MENTEELLNLVDNLPQIDNKKNVRDKVNNKQKLQKNEVLATFTAYFRS